MSFVGVDVGTSFIKGAVLDLEGRTFRHVRRTPFPEPLPSTNPLFYEYDPTQILHAVEGCIRELADLSDTCDGVVLCNQMHSIVLLAADGTVCSPCIGWRDQRAQMPHPSGRGTYFELSQGRLNEEQRRSLGNESPVGSPASTLFWFAEQGLLTSGTVAASVGSFVLSALCNAAPKVDPTNAMAYELLDLKEMEWHLQAIAALGLGRSALPALARQGEIVGHLDHKGQRVPCYAAVGDYQCALAGAMLRPGELSLNISTGSQVSRIDDTLQLGKHQTRPFFDGRFTSTVTHLPAGRALNVLVDLLTELPRLSGSPVADPWTSIVQATSGTASTDLHVATTFFPGPRGSRGAITNIGEGNLRVGSLFHAAFADMAENYHACATMIWPARDWNSVVLSGGLAHKIPLLRKLIEQRFGTAATLCTITEDTLSGLLMLALAFSGAVASVAEAQNAVRESLHNGNPPGGASL